MHRVLLTPYRGITFTTLALGVPEHVTLTSSAMFGMQYSISACSALATSFLFPLTSTHVWGFPHMGWAHLSSRGKPLAADKLR